MERILLLIFALSLSLLSFAQSAEGKWKTIDDKTGKDKSYVEISKAKSGELQGKVIKILTLGKENAKCDHCKGENKGKPIMGMVILWGMKKSGDGWDDGRILDPNNGKEYSCKMRLKDNNTLEIRGFLGISLLGRTQTWHRIH